MQRRPALIAVIVDDHRRLARQLDTLLRDTTNRPARLEVLRRDLAAHDAAEASVVHPILSQRRGGLRSHRDAQGPTKAQLYGEARRRSIPGRSSMTKAELQHALGQRG
jgi:hypothetical protein